MGAFKVYIFTPRYYLILFVRTFLSFIVSLLSLRAPGSWVMKQSSISHDTIFLNILAFFQFFLHILKNICHTVFPIFYWSFQFGDYYFCLIRIVHFLTVPFPLHNVVLELETRHHVRKIRSIRVTRQGTWPWAGLPRASGSVWVFDFIQERFRNTSPGDYEGTFIKAADSKTRKGLA